MQGDITLSASLVSGLIYADPGFPRATGLNRDTNIIGRCIDEFSEIAERRLETENFRIGLVVDEFDKMHAVLTQLGPDENTTLPLAGIGYYLNIRQGEQYSLFDEVLIEVRERYLAFKMNSSWKKWGHFMRNIQNTADLKNERFKALLQKRSRLYDTRLVTKKKQTKMLNQPMAKSQQPIWMYV